MEAIRFEFSMELTRRQSKMRRRYRRVSYKTLQTHTKISRKTILENRNHMIKKTY
jgi:hypothetical protein